MSASYRLLLDATIRHLEDQQARGVKFVTVSRESLALLAAPLTGQPSFESPVSPRESPAVRPTPDVASSPARSPTTPAPAGTPMSRAAKETAMAELRARALSCRNCPHLAASRKNVVFGVGDIHSHLLFVGEAPGSDEDTRGEPFVGKAGQLLTRIIQTMGFSRDTVYIANILKCRPDTPGKSAGNRKPTADEMKTCLPYLVEQIHLIQPRVIVALGATAVEGLLGPSGGITKLRGQWRDFQGIPVMLTYHPAYLLRNVSPVEKRKVWEDMLQVLEKLGCSISEKQRGYFLKH
jgi:uracil-DNA glycosylase